MVGAHYDRPIYREEQDKRDRGAVVRRWGKAYFEAVVKGYQAARMAVIYIPIHYQGKMGRVHPVIERVLTARDQEMSRRGLGDLHSQGVEAARALSADGVAPLEKRPPIHRVEERRIAGPGGDIPLRLYWPNDDKELPLLMWFHGGGWVLGGLENSDLHCRQLANQAGCCVVSVDYRLAPETPYPGAIDDCMAATVWARKAAAELGMDPGRIAVGGDSAGGNLAACVAYRARAAGLPLVFQLLVYPITDADFSRPSYLDNAEGFLLTRSAMQWFWDCYVPDPAKRTAADAAPLRAADLTGLPPAFILTAEFDPLRDEGEAYGAALQEAGVEVVIRRYDGMVHAFFNMITDEPVAQIDAAAQDAVEALRKAFL